MNDGRDRLYETFLTKTFEEAQALSAQSDLVDIRALEGGVPNRWVVDFRCRGLVRTDDGRIGSADRFQIGIWFPTDYLRRAEVGEVLTFLGPSNAFHPNVMPPWICLGRVLPGTLLVELVYRCFAIITYQRVTMREDDALNRDACRWARRNKRHFPVDERPLKWRRPAESGGGITKEEPEQ